MASKTELGPPTEIIDEPVVNSRGYATYVLVIFAFFILGYILYTKCTSNRPFWKKSASDDSDSKDDSDSDDEEKQKKDSDKQDSELSDWDIKKTIQVIEDAQQKLIDHKKIKM